MKAQVFQTLHDSCQGSAYVQKCEPVLLVPSQTDAVNVITKDKNNERSDRMTGAMLDKPHPFRHAARSAALPG
jgi:hypothetical protein